MGYMTVNIVGHRKLDFISPISDIELFIPISDHSDITIFDIGYWID
jgi:hypothetical protein